LLRRYEFDDADDAVLHTKPTSETYFDQLLWDKKQAVSTSGAGNEWIRLHLKRADEEYDILMNDNTDDAK